MENLIKRFLTIEPTGDGYGDGDGYVDGSGYGYGDGYGSGDGDGYGGGSGDGDGDGYGDGYGYGSGDGYGDGYGSGSKSRVNKKSPANDYRKGFIDKEVHTLKIFKGKPVYYVDNIPCIFLSIVENMAKVDIIKDDFSLQRQYIAKSGNLFAHGDTKKHALKAVSDKFFASLTFSEKKEEFLKLFKKDKKYPNQTFFDWHHHLTGSCESGRTMFVQSRGINLGGEMTVKEFLTLTQNEYNGEMIREILSTYG